MARGTYDGLLRHYVGRYGPFTRYHAYLPVFDSLAEMAQFWHECQPWPDILDLQADTLAGHQGMGTSAGDDSGFQAQADDG